MVMDESDDEQTTEASEDELGLDSLSQVSTQYETDFEEETVLMQSHAPKSEPFACQLDQQYPFPWEHQANEPEDDDILLQDHQEELTFGIRQQAVLERLVQDTDVADLNPRGRMTAISFGLGVADLGRRDITFDPFEPASLVRTLAEIWNDHLAIADATIWVVDPQPILQPLPNVVVIVAFSFGGDPEQRMSKALVIEDSEPDYHYHVRPHPYAALIWGPTTLRGLLAQLGLRECFPQGVRNCRLTVSDSEINPGEVIVVPNGALVEPYVTAVPEKVARLRHDFAHVDEFYIGLQLQHERDKKPDVFCIRVHGISPRNQPLGSRDLHFRYEDFDTTNWYADLIQIWPFGFERRITVAFVSGLTEDVDSHEPIFHVILNYATGYIGTPMLIRQTMRSQDGEAPTTELWATLVRPEHCNEGGLRSSLQRHPFWISDEIRTVITKDMAPIPEATESWQPGEILDLNLLANTRATKLMWLLGFENAKQEVQVESHSLLQISAKVQHVDPFQEILLQYASQQSKPDTNEDENAHTVETAEMPMVSKDPAVSSLQAILSQLQSTEWTGINHDWAILDNLHPAAKLAMQVETHSPRAPNRFHVYTDGSASSRQCKEAAWAFVIVCEIGTGDNKQFCRVGYSGARFRVQNPAAAAVEAEAMAIIAAADYLLSRPTSSGVEIHLHFDAQSVGFGATGAQAVPWQKLDQHTRPFEARIMVSLLQKRFHRVLPFHVHGHCGNPFNELADGISRFIRLGHDCPVQPVLRIDALLQHPLRNFAWLEIAPNAELPSLEDLFAKEVWNDKKGWPDKTLEEGTKQRDHTQDQQRVIDLWFATVNVETGDYGQEGHSTGSSHKMREIMHQFATKGYDLVALQETRARYSQTVAGGPFIRFISARERGVGGVELWINREALNAKFGFDLDVDRNSVVWHATSRILAVHLNLANSPMDLIVV